MNWLRLLEIIEMARARTGREPKADRGWSWVCYCPVCCELRKLPRLLRTTETRVTELRALIARATPGPWHVEGDEWGGDIYGPDREADYVAVDHEGLQPSVRSRADADLIVELRNNAAALLDAHDRMAARITRLERFAADTGAWAEAADETNEADVGDGIPARRFDFAGVIEAARAALAVPKEENPDA